MPYMVWKWVCTECCNMNGSEFYSLPQSRNAYVRPATRAIWSLVFFVSMLCVVLFEDLLTFLDDSMKRKLSVMETSSERSSSKSEFLVGDPGKARYRLIRKIGSGSFGEIYQAVNIATGEEVAVKLESCKARHPQLLYESKLYKILQVW